MQIEVLVWCAVGLVVVPNSALADRDQDSSCTQIDFDEATLSSLRQCDFMQEFIAKRYDESINFVPFRSEAVHYLSHRWQGLTCGETVSTYSFNEETELRMAYNLVFDSGATLEVRVFDEERRDPENKPTLVEFWSTTASTDGWGFFREKLNKTVKQARIQIEANINAGSDLAIEYLTIFNYEVETEECSVIDEFSTTTVVPSTTSMTTSSTTTTMFAETTTQQPDTTSSLETTTSDILSTDDVETAPTTEVSEELSTSSLEPTTTTIFSTNTALTTSTTTTNSPTTTTTVPTTTTTNGPRDDTSLQPTSSITEQPNTPTTPTTTESSSTPSNPVAPATTPNTPASNHEKITPKQWLWMTLTALFAILSLLAASAAIYLYFMNQHLQRFSERLLDEIGHYPLKK
uniref:SEA domain-containing protein n=1 Tax=Anopheles epiroticus TaxID=199890 RepID=A0A182PCL0_9DIPT